MDEENVLYCVDCLSLKILGIEGTDVCYCGECGSTNIQETDIGTWESMYEKKNRKKYITRSKRFIY
jgi:hypothetical protein